MTSLINLIIVLIVLGVVLFLIEAYIPLSPPIKIVVRVLIVLFSCFMLLRFAGLV